VTAPPHGNRRRGANRAIACARGGGLRVALRDRHMESPARAVSSWLVLSIASTVVACGGSPGAPPDAPPVPPADAPPADARPCAVGLDPRFGRGGVVIAPSSVEEAAGAAATADGHLLLVGAGAARFTADGQPDPGFHAVPSRPSYLEEGALIRADGSFITFPGATSWDLVARTPAGAFDPSFGVGGVAESPPYDPNDSFYCMTQAIALTPQGGVVAAGRGTTGALCVTRWDASGHLDRSFGAGTSSRAGVALVSSLPSGFDVAAVAVAADGGIVVGGSIDAAPQTPAIVRLRPDGALDPSFGDGGAIRTPLVAGLGTVAGLDLMPDGTIVVLEAALYKDVRYWASLDGTSAPLVLGRYTAAGRPDPAFATVSLPALPFTPIEVVPALVRTPDSGHVVVVAGYTDSSTYVDAVAEVTAAGALDPRISGGWFSLPASRQAGPPIVTADGSIVLATMHSADAIALIRLSCRQESP
jgi:uncharacterized delta-60 repeat protein